jgi:head-tail adaptor
MRAGRLRHRVTLKQPATQTANAANEAIGTPATVSSAAGDGKWAADVRPLSGTEGESGRQVQAGVTHEIRMRYSPGTAIVPTWLVVHDSRDLEVVSVLNVNERDHELILLAREMV